MKRTSLACLFALFPLFYGIDCVAKDCGCAEFDRTRVGDLVRLRGSIVSSFENVYSIVPDDCEKMRIVIARSDGASSIGIVNQVESAPKLTKDGRYIFLNGEILISIVSKSKITKHLVGKIISYKDMHEKEFGKSYPFKF